MWLGTIDDLWQFGKPTGHGGPWKDSPTRAGQPSDAYLFTGYDRRTLTLSHDAAEPVTMRVEVDISGEGDWCSYHSFAVPPGRNETHVVPEAFAAQWLRVIADRDCRATAWLTYEQVREANRPIALGGDGQLAIEIVIDRSNVEVFVGDGAAVLSGISFPAATATEVAVEVTSGSANFEKLELRGLAGDTSAK